MSESGSECVRRATPGERVWEQVRRGSGKPDRCKTDLREEGERAGQRVGGMAVSQRRYTSHTSGKHLVHSSIRMNVSSCSNTKLVLQPTHPPQARIGRP